MQKWIVRIGLACVTFVVALAVMDRLVSLLVPAIPPRVAHPKNFSERRESIEFSYEFRTNSQGLRYPEIPLRATSPAERRIVVVGDSFTEGMGVAYENTFTAVMERELSRPEQPVRVINAGLSGTGPLEYARVLFCVGMNYGPDLVLINLHANDTDDTSPDAKLDVVRTEAGTFRVDAPDGLLWKPSGSIKKTMAWIAPWTYRRLQYAQRQRDDRLIDELGFVESVRERARRKGVSEEHVNRWLERIPPEILQACEEDKFSRPLVALGCLHPGRMRACLDIEGGAANDKWLAMKGVLADTVQLCHELGVAVGFVYSPTPHQHDPSVGHLRKTVGVETREEWLTEQCELESRLTALAQELDVPFCSLTDPFRDASQQHPGRYNYSMDEHWNAEGHRLAAEAIIDWLRNSGLIACLAPPS